MPVCITCNTRVPYLYTVYQSNYNLRLEQCPNCRNFADPYVENDNLILTLDLFLFKRGVYRHLLYNRGAPPRYAQEKAQGSPSSPSTSVNSPKEGRAADADRREVERWSWLLRLGALLVLVDAFIRYCHFHRDDPLEVTPWDSTVLNSFIRVLVACIAETISFHGGIVTACYFIPRISKWLLAKDSNWHPFSNGQTEFRLSMVPLALFYSSLTKLFLLFLLTIWQRPSAESSDNSMLAGGTMAAVVAHTLERQNSKSIIWDTPYVEAALQMLEREKIDREWIIRNALGGMSAGFGLRVVLDCHPGLTTLVILVGWAAKTCTNQMLSKWVGGDDSPGDAWFVYSVP